jgi:glucose-fructose oxidoreductase
VTGTPSKVPMWQEKYGIESANVYSYDTMAGLIDNPNIHVVYIVTPNHLHMQYAIAAARAKKHVWCEKPMAMDVPECQAIIDACRENGVQLCIGYRVRHEPNTQTVIGYATSKPYGAILNIVADAGFRGFGNADDATAYRLKRAMGGGALYDMGLYAINAARYAAGEEPIRVRNARQWTERPEIFTEVDEWTEFELEFPSGVVAHVRTTFGENIDSLDVTCESGSYRLAPMNVYTGVKGETSDGIQLNQTIPNQQAKQMDDDALALIEGRAVLAPGEEGLQGVRIISAIQEAASTGQAVDL